MRGLQGVVVYYLETRLAYDWDDETASDCVDPSSNLETFAAPVSEESQFATGPEVSKHGSGLNGKRNGTKCVRANGWGLRRSGRCSTIFSETRSIPKGSKLTFRDRCA